MFKKNHFRKLAILFIIPLVSCLSNEGESEFDAFVDAYTIKKVVGDEPVYALTLFVYGNQFISSTSVTQLGGSGEKINLSQNPQSIFTFSKIPEASDYKPYGPAASEYLFEIVSESGVSMEISDFLDPQDLDIPTITKAEFEGNEKLLVLEWEQVANADGYIVKIRNEEGLYIFTGHGLEPEVNTYTINILLGNWVESANPGENYTIEVHTFAYEADAKEAEYVYNIQDLSISETQLMWE